MGEVQETIVSCECQNIQAGFAQDFSCWQKADRCRSKSKVGASKGPTDQEGGLVSKLQKKRPDSKIGPQTFNGVLGQWMITPFISHSLSA